MTKTEHGYILLYVGKKHHLADCRGYAYLHRVNAEKKIGRRLRKGEEVHHDDGNRDNNEDYNLIVKKNHADHMVSHRKEGCNRKLPEQENYLIECLCGCGEKFLKFDAYARPRDYVTGHNPTESAMRDKIRELLSSGEKSVSEMVKSSGYDHNAIKTALSRMCKAKEIVRIEWGIYGEVGSVQRKRENSYIECLCGCGNKFLKFDTGWRERKYISGHNTRNLYGNFTTN